MNKSRRLNIAWMLLSGLAACLAISGCAGAPAREPGAPAWNPATGIPAASKDAKEEAMMAFFAGQLADMREDFSRAAAYYRRALKLDPDSLTLRRHLINDLILLKRFGDALREYDILAVKSPEDARNHYVLGQLHESAGNTGQAEAFYREALAAGEAGSAPMTQLGLLCLKQDRKSEAVAWLDKAIVRNPRDREAVKALVQYYLSQDQTRPAEQLLRRAWEQMPDDVQWLAGLASLVAEDPARLTEAAALFSRLARLYPAYPEAHRFLANHHLKRKKWEDAADHLERLSKLEPQAFSVRRNLARAYYHMGDYSRARDVLLALVEHGHADAFTHYLLGAVYQKKKHIFLAADAFRSALRLEPGLSEAYVGLAQILMETNELENAGALLAIALEKFPDDPELLLIQGMVLLRRQQPRPALQVLQRAAQALPRQALAQFHLGRAYDQLSDFGNAVRCWKKAVQLDPGFAEPYNYLAYLHAERNRDLDQALAWVKRALALSPESGYYQDTLGWVYYKQGKYRLALEQILKARETMKAGKMGVDPVIYEHLGDVYYKLKKYPEARREWSRALELDPKNAGLQKKLGTMKTSEGKKLP